MKKMTPYVVVFVMFLFSVSAMAQDKADNKEESEVPKELLLSTLNGVAHLKLDNDQITQLMDYNKGFVDEIYEILDSDKEDKYKKKSLKALANTRETDLKEFLGNHKTNKYLKLMEDELKPLGRRDHRLKEIAKS